MQGQRLGYVRVSSVDQNPDRQLDGLALDRVFTDRASGKDTQRPQLAALLQFAREGDTAVVTFDQDFDRVPSIRRQEP